jgi:hypothetical protein
VIKISFLVVIRMQNNILAGGKRRGEKHVGNNFEET